MESIENYLKKQKLAELELNYVSAKSILNVGSKSYRITYENIVDIIGLISLNIDSDLGVMENNQINLVNHSVDQLKELLEKIRVHLTALKTNRLMKQNELNGLDDHDLIMNFDVNL
jgi:hypothetical protein